MSRINYSKLAVLIADDFSSFRNTVNGMLLNLGVTSIAMASNGQEVIDKCGAAHFDVILCDYDLGPGRNGQHVLEELRFRELISRRNIFIMVSAEASRNIVMSAYDCEPDDYLMKPITAMMLQQRMTRLVAQRAILKPAYDALEKGEIHTAIDRLTDLSLADNRHSVVAQKLLGQLFVEQGELNKAEKLYTRALEIRQLDWARLGLARVKQHRGELDTAGDWLDRIVEDNPLYLPAYDVLADNWEKKGELQQAQRTVERAVEVSPMSILRQKRLAHVAHENSDLPVELEARRRTVRLGKLSCYGTADDHLSYVRAVSHAIKEGLSVSGDIQEEVKGLMKDTQAMHGVRQSQIAQCFLLEGQVYAATGRGADAKLCLTEADALMERDTQIDAEVDRIELLIALKEDEQANSLLRQLKEQFADDEEALEKLDKYLEEPVSEVNRAFVASVNREGIDLYNHSRFDEALACFDKAKKLFPKHVGLHLNIVQSLIGKLKRQPEDNELFRECQAVLAKVEDLIDAGHSQYPRYLTLRNKVKDMLEEQI